MRRGDKRVSEFLAPGFEELAFPAPLMLDRETFVRWCLSSSCAPRQGNYAYGAYRAADTQGKRGKKALRMTMAFSEENMDYIRTMGKLESGGATAYVNRLIEADRRKHADVYRQMKTLRPDA